MTSQHPHQWNQLESVTINIVFLRICSSPSYPRKEAKLETAFTPPLLLQKFGGNLDLLRPLVDEARIQPLSVDVCRQSGQLGALTNYVCCACLCAHTVTLGQIPCWPTPPLPPSFSIHCLPDTINTHTAPPPRQ